MKSRINSLVVVVLFLFTTLLADAALADKKSSSDRDGADGREASRNQPARAENRPSAANPAPAASTPKQDTPAAQIHRSEPQKAQSRGRSAAKVEEQAREDRGQSAPSPSVENRPSEKRPSPAMTVFGGSKKSSQIQPSSGDEPGKNAKRLYYGPKGPSFTVPKTNHVAVEKPAESKPAETMVSEAESGDARPAPDKRDSQGSPARTIGNSRHDPAPEPPTSSQVHSSPSGPQPNPQGARLDNPNPADKKRSSSRNDGSASAKSAKPEAKGVGQSKSESGGKSAPSSVNHGVPSGAVQTVRTGETRDPGKANRSIEKLSQRRPEVKKELADVRPLYERKGDDAKAYYQKSSQEARKHSDERKEITKARIGHTLGINPSPHHQAVIEYHQYEHRDHDFDINVVHEYAPYHHDHGPGCGHLFYHNHWHYYPVTYYNRCRANSFFFFVDLGGYDVRYVPTYVREVQVRYETVPVDVYVADDPLSLAYRHFADGEYFLALASFHEAVRQSPDDGLIYFARAQAYFAVGDYADAYADLIQGMEIIPDWPAIRVHLAELYSDPEDFYRQQWALEQWVSRHPRDWRSHFLLGYVYYFTEEYDLARSELLYTLAYAEDHPQALALLDALYEREAEKYE